jgi:Domain of unknown function DUF11
VTVMFVVSNCGYFEPYGGGSPGPRFLTAALPFLALGLGPAFAWRPRLTLAAAALSVIPTTAAILTWLSNDLPSGTIWSQLARAPFDHHSWIAKNLSANALSALGPGRDWGALLVAFCCAGALAVGVRGMPWPQIRAHRRAQTACRRPPRRVILAGVACVALVAVADGLAFTNEPYGLTDADYLLVILHTSISAPSRDSYLGGEVNFTVNVTDDGYLGAGNLLLTLNLSPGMRLVGPPAHTLGSGCTGTATITCNLGTLLAKGAETATVYFGVQITQPTDQKLTASASAVGDPHSPTETFNVSVGN